MSIYLSIYLSICLSIYLSRSHSLSRSLFLSFSLCLYLYIHTYTSIFSRTPLHHPSLYCIILSFCNQSEFLLISFGNRGVWRTANFCAFERRKIVVRVGVCVCACVFVCAACVSTVNNALLRTSSQLSATARIRYGMHSSMLPFYRAWRNQR